MCMNPSDSQISEYKQKAEGLVQDWLRKTSGDNFVRTCEKCNTPLRDDSITGEEIVFIVTTLGAFMDHDSQVHYRCPNHSGDAERLVERLLTSRAVSITGVVRQGNGGLVVDTHSVTFHN